jgi:flagellar motor switch protein FliN/FliY
MNAAEKKDGAGMSEELAQTLTDSNEEDQLNKAIEELRGVLKDESKPAAAQLQAASAGPGTGAANSSLIMNIPVEVQIVLGGAEMPVSELMALQKGSTVALNRRIGEPVDVVVNGRRIARGEITVLENDPSRFGVKLTEIITAAKI